MDTVRVTLSIIKRLQFTFGEVQDEHELSFGRSATIMREKNDVVGCMLSHHQTRADDSEDESMKQRDGAILKPSSAGGSRSQGKFPTPETFPPASETSLILTCSISAWCFGKTLMSRSPGLTTLAFKR